MRDCLSPSGTLALRHSFTLLFTVALILLPGRLLADELVDYLRWQQSQLVSTPELHYPNHDRKAFAVANEMAHLEFNLHAPAIGLTKLHLPNASHSLSQPGSLNLTIVDEQGATYQS